VGLAVGGTPGFEVLGYLGGKMQKGMYLGSQQKYSTVPMAKTSFMAVELIYTILTPGSVDP